MNYTDDLPQLVLPKVDRERKFSSAVSNWMMEELEQALNLANELANETEESKAMKMGLNPDQCRVWDKYWKQFSELTLEMAHDMRLADRDSEEISHRLGI